MGNISDINTKKTMKNFNYIINSNNPLPDWAKITYTKINGKRRYIKGIICHEKEVELQF